MGLSRDIREINRQILTDKQQKQIDRQERQQLKDLQLLENAQKQHLQLFIKSKIQYYLELDFNKYKNDLYLLSLKNEIQQDFINKNKEYVDIVFIFFDEYYYKTLKEQINIYNKNQQAIANNTPTPPPVVMTSKEGIHMFLSLAKAFLQVAFNIFAVFGGILLLFTASGTNKRRRL